MLLGLAAEVYFDKPRRNSSVARSTMSVLMDGVRTELAKVRQNYCAEERIDGIAIITDGADHDKRERADSAWMS